MIHIIANPKACSGATRQTVENLTNQLTLLREEHIVHTTDRSGRASQLAARLPLTPEDRLVIVGGDGSLNEVINGLPLPAVCPVLLLPAGTGNDFARGLAMERSVSAAVSLLRDPSSRPVSMDLGNAVLPDPEGTEDSRNFAVSCGLGMDAEVCHVMAGSPVKALCNRWKLGKLSYLIHGVQVVFTTSRCRRAVLQVTLDGEETLNCPDTAFLSCHNTPFEGGGFPFAPKATPRDGLLSVCIIQVPNRLMLVPILLSSLLGGRHPLFRSFVTIRSCRSLEVHASHPLCFHCDGEFREGITEFRASALPAVLPLLYSQRQD